MCVTSGVLYTPTANFLSDIQLAENFLSFLRRRFGMSRNPVCQFRVTHVTFRNLDPSSAHSSVISEVRVFSAGVGQNEREGSGFPALTIEGPGLSVWGFLIVCMFLLSSVCF